MEILPGRMGGRSERRTTFTGEVWADTVLPPTDGVAINAVFFPPGARTYWHRHENGQVIQVVTGDGLVCADGERPHRIRPGDVVWSPPGERHWHGATAESAMLHTAVSLGQTQWEEEVTDGHYSLAPADSNDSPEGSDD